MGVYLFYNYINIHLIFIKEINCLLENLYTNLFLYSFVSAFDKNYSGVDDGNTVTKAVTITMTVASAYIILVVGLTVWCRYKRRPRNSNCEGISIIVFFAQYNLFYDN